MCAERLSKSKAQILKQFIMSTLQKLGIKTCTLSTIVAQLVNTGAVVDSFGIQHSIGATVIVW